MNPHHPHKTHVTRTVKSFLRAFYFTVGIFVLIFVFFRIGRAVYVSNIVEKSTESFHAGMKERTDSLKKQGDKIASSSAVAEYLLANDSQKLLEFMQKEAEKYDIDALGVANRDGVNISRTKKLGVKNDNVFLTIPEGRIVAMGQSVENIGQSTSDPSQLRMSTGTRSTMPMPETLEKIIFRVALKFYFTQSITVYSEIVSKTKKSASLQVRTSMLARNGSRTECLIKQYLLTKEIFIL
jgi:hypothetical protein